MHKISLLGAVAGFAALCGGPAVAQQTASSGPFALGLGVGTNGGVIEGSYRLSPQFVLRAQGAFIDFDADFKSSDVKYSGRLHFNTGGGFIDWHPFSNNWLLSAGAVAGDRSVDVNARPTGQTIAIHGVPFPVSQVGQVNGKIDFGDPAPFAGLGWDNTYTARGPIGFRAIAGVVFGDAKPAVRLRATGSFAADPAVIAALQSEQASLQRDARDYRYYPIVQLGVNYRF